MSVDAKPTGIFFIALTLLMASLPGLEQQESVGDYDDQDTFHPKELIEHIKQTRSLGGLTKLSLKKDYDRLINKARDYHDGNEDISLEQLRERYDVMLQRLKVLLQDKDEELVIFIHNAQDRFWMILSDEEQFAIMMSALP